MSEIILSNGQVVLVDADDYSELSKYTWSPHSSGYVRRTELDTLSNKRKTVYLHRHLMQPPKGKFIDHINGNKLDNRRSNLRVCTMQENNRNKSKQQKPSSSKYSGVDLRQNGKWRARVKLSGKPIHLGYFNTEEEAALAYNEAALFYYGEFARVNVIGDE